MNVYLDASVLVAFLADEPRGLEVRRWLDRQLAGTLMVSAWCDTEVSSALGRKRRMGTLTAEIEVEAREVWRSAIGSLFALVPVEAADFFAADLCARPDLALRGPDALHLAVARRLGLQLATFDTGMADAATSLAIPLAEPGLAAR